MVHCDDDIIKLTIDDYSDMVYRICFVYLKSHSDVEDAFQDIFIKVIEKAPQFVNEGHKKAWIITVTANHCKNILKKRKRENNIAFDESSIVTKTSNKEDIMPIILNLPLDYRNVIYLYYYEGYSTKEISDMLHKRDATIRTWLKRSREMLKTRMGGAFDE